VLERPANEWIGGVRGRLSGDVRIGVQPVQGAQTGEVEIAKDILGDQWRAKQQHEVRGDDRARQRSHGQRARGEQHRQVARAHDQYQRLEAIRGDTHTKALKGARHPARPAATTGRDVL
jgi:hypothetical protein